jgi:hypothetical protein
VCRRGAPRRRGECREELARHHPKSESAQSTTTAAPRRSRTHRAGTPPPSGCEHGGEAQRPVARAPPGDERERPDQRPLAEVLVVPVARPAAAPAPAARRTPGRPCRPRLPCRDGTAPAETAARRMRGSVAGGDVRVLDRFRSIARRTRAPTIGWCRRRSGS